MKKTAVFGMLVGTALALSWLESMIGLTPGIPGIKLGLPNLIVVFCLYRYGERTALGINLLRILLVSFLFSGMYGMLYSLAGALLSFAAMAVAKRRMGLSMIGVSVCGGVFHNIGQLLTAMCIIRSVWAVFYLPWLLLAGCLTGIAIGVLARELCRRLPEGQNLGG